MLCYIPIVSNRIDNGESVTRLFYHRGTSQRPVDRHIAVNKVEQHCCCHVTHVQQ